MSIPALVASLALGAFAQAPNGSPPDLQGVNAFPLAAAPFSLEATGVGESNLADGNVVVWANEGKIYRDSQGRTRTEYTLPTLGPIPQDSRAITAIRDPVAGFQFFLIASSQVAYRAPYPKSDPSFRPSFGFVSGLVRETGKKAVKNEALGKQTIEGVEFEGSRTTTTMVDDPLKFAVDEYWISQEMGLIGAALRSSPTGKTTVKIKKLLRQDPDPSLFVVPSDYRIEDIKMPVPAK